MVQKCCVPGCKTPADMPSHRIPNKKKEVWLTKIGRLDLISIPVSQLNKFRICYVHFSEEMVRVWSKIRLLKPDAEPILYLPEDNDNWTTKRDSQNLSSLNEKTCGISQDNSSSDCNSTFATSEIPLIDISDEDPTDVQIVQSDKVPVLNRNNYSVVKSTLSSISAKRYRNMTLKDIQILKLKNKLKIYQEKYCALNRKMKRLQETMKRDKFSKNAQSDMIDLMTDGKRKASVGTNGNNSQIVKKKKKQSH